MALMLLPTADFERNLQELEALVDEMENRDLSPEASIEHFKRGFKLAHDCQHALRIAEHQVTQWMASLQPRSGGEHQHLC